MTKPTWEERFDKLLQEEYPEICMRPLLDGNHSWKYIKPDKLSELFSSIIQETEERVRGEMVEKIKKEFIDKYRCELFSNDTFSERLQKETTNSMLDELWFFIS